jgi:hypothetical protein
MLDPLPVGPKRRQALCICPGGAWSPSCPVHWALAPLPVYPLLYWSEMWLGQG